MIRSLTRIETMQQEFEYVKQQSAAEIGPKSSQLNLKISCLEDKNKKLEEMIGKEVEQRKVAETESSQ
jgi:hypothetical protein